MICHSEQAKRRRRISFIVEDVVHDQSRVLTSEAGLHPFDRLRSKERGIVCAQRRQSLIDFDCGEGVLQKHMYGKKELQSNNYNYNLRTLYFVMLSKRSVVETSFKKNNIHVRFSV